MQRMPKAAIEKWRRYLQGLKDKSFFDNLRSAKLLNCLSRIPVRITRDTLQGIIGGASKIQGAMQAFVYDLKNIPRNALSKIKQLCEDTNNKNFMIIPDHSYC